MIYFPNNYRNIVTVFRSFPSIRNINLITFGNVYCDKGEYDKALNYFDRSLAIREEIGEKPLIARNYNRIEAVHSDKGDYGKAEKWLYHKYIFNLWYSRT